MSRYDVAAEAYEAYRGLPSTIVERIRAAVLDAIRGPDRARLLDLGAGSGRIGRAFVAAGDDYVGADLSLGMLRQFAGRADTTGGLPRLVQADGEHLPFADATFDVVLLIQVFGGLDEWRPFVGEARRVLRPRGTLVLGRTAMPEDGVDARMKERLDAILANIGVAHARKNAREHVQRWLGTTARGGAPIVASAWDAERTPRGFLDRHRTGARFSLLPEAVKDEAMRRLSTWAVDEFGSLDAATTERHAFELRFFTFHDEVRS